MLIELYVAIAILVLVMIPIGASFLGEQNACRGAYYRAVAMELVDGEMEVLRAGGWRQFGQGRHVYVMTGGAAKNLSGTFLLTRDGKRIRLEWQPARKGLGGAVVREATIPGANQ